MVVGAEEVLRLTEQLKDFIGRCGQNGAMQDIGFFLSKPGALPRIPHLLLVSRSGALDLRRPDQDNLLGLLLIFEYRVLGIKTGAFATNDRSGRSTLIAEPQHRSSVAGLTSRALLNDGARMVLMSFCNEDSAEENPGEGVGPLLTPKDGKVIADWALRDRSVPGYLPLLPTFDETLARIGQRTRSNLRYYRRRVEARVGCVLVPEITVSREEVMSFNRQCWYAVPEKVAKWRYDSLSTLGRPVLMGLKDRDGQWLSMLGGRRYDDRSEIFWQLNHTGYAADSLSTVMRSYFIEHEISQGSRRMYIEGGTAHPMRYSFVMETLTDLVVVRRTPVAKTMEKLAERYISEDNELSQMLGSKDLEWLPC
jgi:hypothetical protein